MAMAFKCDDGGCEFLDAARFSPGAIIHAEYLAQGRVRHYETYLKRKVSELKARHPSKCFQQHSAVNYSSSVEMVNALPDKSVGNAVVLMTWALHKKVAC